MSGVQPYMKLEGTGNANQVGLAGGVGVSKKWGEETPKTETSVFNETQNQEQVTAQQEAPIEDKASGEVSFYQGFTDYNGTPGTVSELSGNSVMQKFKAGKNELDIGVAGSVKYDSQQDGFQARLAPLDVSCSAFNNNAKIYGQSYIDAKSNTVSIGTKTGVAYTPNDKVSIYGEVEGNTHGFDGNSTTDCYTGLNARVGAKYKF